MSSRMFRGGAFSQQLFFVTKVSGYCDVLMDYISMVYDSLILHNRSVENRTQRCLCVDGMLEMNSGRSAIQNMYISRFEGQYWWSINTLVLKPSRLIWTVAFYGGFSARESSSSASNGKVFTSGAPYGNRYIVIRKSQ